MKPESALAKPRKQVITAEDREKVQDSIEDAQAEHIRRDREERNKADKVSKFLDGNMYVENARPTNLLMATRKLHALKPAELEALPNDWQFSRFYQAINTVIDLLPTEQEYKAANVEARRRWCGKQGFKYAALGPAHRTYDLAPQLGLMGK